MSSHELAMALRLAYLAVHRRTDAVMSVHGVTADQFVVLKTISENEGVSQKELAERVGCDRNTLRAMLVLLEQRGYVCRQVDVSDQRAWRVWLSKNGKSVLKKLWKESLALRDEMFGSMQQRDLARLLELLKQLTESVQTCSTPT